MARGELHIQLSVNYADDEKFDEVTRSARLLYVDACCSAKKLLNDGRFSRAKVRKLMAPESSARADKAAAELVDAGLWLWDDAQQVFIIAAWLKRNKSKAQLEQDRRDAEEAALQANHKRWHLARDVRDEKCAYCRSEQPPDGSGTRSGTRSSPGESMPDMPSEFGHAKVTGEKKLINDRSGSSVQVPNRSEDGPHSTAVDENNPSSQRFGASGTRSGGRERSESTETETETETETKNKNQPPDPPRRAAPPAPHPEPPSDDAGEPGAAERLVTTWMNGCNRRPPSRVVNDIGRLVAEMIRDGTDPADIERGLRLWQSRGSNPKTLPSFVNQVMNARPTNVVAISAHRPSTTDQRVSAALALAEKFREDPA